MSKVAIAVLLVVTLATGCSSGPGSGPDAVPGVSALPVAQMLTALPVDVADVTWIAPFWPSHMGFDFGMTTVGRFYPGFPIWLWYFCPSDPSPCLDLRGFRMRHPARMDDTQWVNYKPSPFSSRSTDF